MNPDIIKHVRGESIFIDDMPVPEGTLYASVFFSAVAHAKIKSISIDDTSSSEGVKPYSHSKIFRVKIKSEILFRMNIY